MHVKRGGSDICNILKMLIVVDTQGIQKLLMYITISDL
jgi:hypothetical protein